LEKISPICLQKVYSVALEGTPWDSKLDLSKLLKLGEHLETIAT